LRPFRGLFEGNEGEQAAKAVGNWIDRAKKAGKFLTRTTLELGAGMAAGKVAHAVTHFDELDVPGGEEWITQGIALVAGHYVHAKTAAVYTRIQNLPSRLRSKALNRLGNRAIELGNRAEAASKNPSREVALELLAERNRLLLEEARIYKGL